ncbi:MAG: PAS domain-containing protein [Kiritimatiellae bacterium]|nr:PAS domain-containing protein [Kiritimatiellia bacterium]
MKDFFKGVRRHIDKMDAERLREQYARLSDEAVSLDTLFKTIAQGIIVLDERGEIVKSNPAARELLGMRPEDALPSLSVPLGKASKRDLDVSYPQARTLEVQTVPMDAGTLVYLRDVTAERERTEEELRAGATQAVRDLAAGVAHEIGNPLNALSLNLQLLNRTHGPDDSIDECLRQVERLAGIIHGFLQALRPSKPNLVRGSVADPIKGCLKTMSPQFEERRITVTLDIQSAIPSVAIDTAQMEQVFFNLLKNALEAVPDGGAIDIDLSSDDNDVITTVRDNGLGMEPEQVAHLFEPYRTTKERGTGLGLMVSARIVRDHGGTIAVESTPGEGTTFTIRLPRIERRIRALKG